MHKEKTAFFEKWDLHRKERGDIIVENGGVIMRDFPIFTTEYGVSSLFLKEIPYKNEAYIRIRDVQKGFLKEHLEECVKFCRMAGAERIFAADHSELDRWPYGFSQYEMRGTAWVDPKMLENLFPVTEATVGQWRHICNEKMRHIPCTATQTSRDEKEILAGGAYFVHQNGQLLGIGWVKDPELRAIAAVKPGAGERVMHTLMSLMEGDTMTLEVASTNTRAIRLYEKLGFMKTAETARWYDVTKLSY